MSTNKVNAWESIDDGIRSLVPVIKSDDVNIGPVEDDGNITSSSISETDIHGCCLSCGQTYCESSDSCIEGKFELNTGELLNYPTYFLQLPCNIANRKRLLHW